MQNVVDAIFEIRHESWAGPWRLTPCGMWRIYGENLAWKQYDWSEYGTEAGWMACTDSLMKSGVLDLLSVV